MRSGTPSVVSSATSVATLGRNRAGWPFPAFHTRLRVPVRSLFPASGRQPDCGFLRARPRLHDEPCDPPRHAIRDTYDRLLPLSTIDTEHPHIGGSRPGRARSGRLAFSRCDASLRSAACVSSGHCPPTRRPTSEPLMPLSPHLLAPTPRSRPSPTRPRSLPPSLREEGRFSRSGDTFRHSRTLHGPSSTGDVARRRPTLARPFASGGFPPRARPPFTLPHRGATRLPGPDDAF